MKVAVIGGRDFNDKKHLYAILSNLRVKPELIISGGALGADTLAEAWAKENNIPTQIFYPDWNKHGKAAGPIRNKLIVESCDVCIAFWDGKSRGTRSSIDMCKSKGVRYHIAHY